jgi:hypothetical protein
VWGKQIRYPARGTCVLPLALRVNPRLITARRRSDIASPLGVPQRQQAWYSESRSDSVDAALTPRRVVDRAPGKLRSQPPGAQLTLATHLDACNPSNGALASRRSALHRHSSPQPLEATQPNQRMQLDVGCACVPSAGGRRADQRWLPQRARRGPAAAAKADRPELEAHRAAAPTNTQTTIRVFTFDFCIPFATKWTSGAR